MPYLLLIKENSQIPDPKILASSDTGIYSPSKPKLACVALKLYYNSGDLNKLEAYDRKYKAEKKVWRNRDRLMD